MAVCVHGCFRAWGCRSRHRHVRINVIPYKTNDHTYIRTYICIYVRTCDRYMCIYVYDIYVRTYIRTYIRTSLCTYTYVYMILETCLDQFRLQLFTYAAATSVALGNHWRSVGTQGSHWHQRRADRQQRLSANAAQYLYATKYPATQLAHQGI